MPHPSSISYATCEKEAKSILHLYEKGEFALARTQIQKLLRKFPEYGNGWKVLGLCLHALGNRPESIRAKEKAVALMPQDWETHFNLGIGYQYQGELLKAVESYLNCLHIKPDHADSYNNMAHALQQLGQFKDAELSCRQALALQPDMANAHHNLGIICNKQGKWSEACACYFEALRLKPDWAEAYNNLAITLQSQGLMQEAQAYSRKALKIKPDWDGAHSNLLFILSHDVMLEPASLFSEHLAFGTKFEAPLRALWKPHHNSKDPDRQLQIGFVSGDLYHHATASFLEPVLHYLCGYNDLSLHAYYTHTTRDDVTQRLAPLFSHWHDVAFLSSEELAKQIRSDGIDILIDLSGHTAHNRLLSFALKPAPVQMSWLGYPCTTGLHAIDYYLCDRFWLPPDELSGQFTEKLAYMPVTAIFKPSDVAPAVNLLPAQENGYITFGSFNRTNKINQSVIVLWSLLLRSSPNSQMLFGSISQDQEENLIQNFAIEGIDKSRLRFHPRASLQDYLMLHHQVDICLDTFPYSGGTTTNHAAWMGVPTLTLAGGTPPSRSSATLMHFWGCDEFIATSIEDFVSKGTYWTDHVHELAQIRNTMRSRFETSPLGQADEFAASLDSLLRTAWRRWCNGQTVTELDAKVVHI